MAKTSILLVEDNRDEVDLMREALAGVDTELVVQVAGDIGAAWTLLMGLPVERLPALVITDHHLPDGSGQDLLARVRACPSHRHLTLVMVSGDAERPTDLVGIAWYCKPDTWAGWRQLAHTLAALTGGP